MTTEYRRYLINIVKHTCQDAQHMEIKELEKNFSELWNNGKHFVSASECLKAVRIEFGIEEDCPICYKYYGNQEDGSFLTKDGKDNSGYAEVCKHYVCHECCWKLSKQDNIACPLCREDWTDWIHTHYTESDDEDE